MSVHPEYVRIAHRRAVWAEIQRMLQDRFVNTELSQAKEQIICEEVPFSLKEVSQEALFEVLERLEQLQEEERQDMNQFEMRRRDVRKKPAGEQSAAGAAASADQSKDQTKAGQGDGTQEPSAAAESGEAAPRAAGAG